MSCKRCELAPAVSSHAWCRSCLNEYQRERRKNNPYDGSQNARNIRKWQDKYYGQRNKTARSITQPTSRDLEWAAGFLEGEGTFRASARSEHVNAGQNERETLDRLKALFGGAVRSYPNTHRDEFFQWYVSGTRARGVMMTLYLLLSTRRQAQIRKALSLGQPKPRGGAGHKKYLLKNDTTNESSNRVTTLQM